MTPDQISAFRTAVAEIKTVSVAASQPHSAESLSDLLQQQNIKNASIDLVSLTATGFTDAGIAAIGYLAKSFRPSLSANSKAASHATLGKYIASEVVAHWKGRQASSLVVADFDSLQRSVEDWFTAQKVVRRHVVPCTIFPHSQDTFSIGPVLFCHALQFPSKDFGVSPDEFWPKPPPRWKQWIQNVSAAIQGKTVVLQRPGGFHFETFLDFAASRSAPWMALVDVPGRAADESARAADLAVDVALASIQIVSPG